MQIHIRTVTPSDALIWNRMRGELWPDASPPHGEEIAAFFVGTLAEPNAVLLAENPDAVIVGFAELSVRTDVPGLAGKRTGYVEGLYVPLEFRHRGVAQKLLLASRDWARAQACVAFASDRADRFVVDANYCRQPLIG